MNILLTSRVSRRPELRIYAAELRALGDEVPSGWLDELDDEDPVANGADATPTNMSFSEAHDLKDVKTAQSIRVIEMAKSSATIYAEVVDADLVIAFTDSENHTREEAYGIYFGALLRRKRTWIVGGRFHKLHFFKDVPTFKNFDECKVALAALKKTLAGKRKDEA